MGSASGQKAPFKVLYDNDLLHIAYGAGSWRYPDSTVLTKSEINRRIQTSVRDVTPHHVDAHFFRPGLGLIPLWKSKSYPASTHYEQWESETKKKASIWGQYMLDQRNFGDILQVFVDVAKAEGQAAFVSLLMNDTHHGIKADSSGVKIDVMAQLKKPAHQRHLFTEWIPDYIKEQKNYLLDSGNSRSGQDWAYPEVRELKLDFIKELCSGYSIDGIELDFMRFPKYFQSNMPKEERVKIMSSFIAEVRTILDARQLGETNKDAKRWLCLRLPVHQKINDELGIDLDLLEGLGVDMVIFSSFFYTMQQNLNFQSIRNKLPNIAIYHELHSTTWRHSTKGGTKNFGRIPTYKEQLYTTANLAYSYGFDGMSVFNFQYLRKINKGRIPFEMLDLLSDPEALSKYPNQWYFQSKNWKDGIDVDSNKGLPQQFDVNPQHEFKFITKLAKPSDLSSGSLRLFFDTSIKGLIWSAKVNNIQLQPSVCKTNPTQSSYNLFFDKVDQSACFEIPPRVVKEDLNQLTVVAGSDMKQNTTKLLYYDLILMPLNEN